MWWKGVRPKKAAKVLKSTKDAKVVSQTTINIDYGKLPSKKSDKMERQGKVAL